MANIQGASLEPIYNRLNSAPNYHPLEADTFADWSMESGDIVTVTRDGQSYASPVHHTSMTWRKGQKISVSSTGNKERGGISKISQKKYNRGSSTLRNTGYTHWNINNKYDQMRTGIIQTESSMLLYANSKYNEMGTGLRLTESSALLYAYSKYNEMGTGLQLTASSAVLYATSKYSEMRTGLTLTASSAVLYASSKYSEMRTGLTLTASSAVLYATNKYAEMKTGLNLTASSATLYASSKYSEMRTGLSLTASSAVLYATNKYNEMVSGLNLTESSAMLYAKNRTTRAYIVARINASGEGEALIEADKVKISGTTTINDVMTITDNRVRIKTDAQISGNLLTDSVTFRGQSSSGTISGDDIEGFIKSASVDGNTLTLTPVRGDEITFSKATTLSGTWGSGTFTVSASPQGDTISAGLFDVTNADITWSGNTASFPVYANLNSGETKYSTGKTLSIDATDRYNAGDTAGYNRGYTAGGRTGSVGGPNSITRNGTYTYKGYYENQDGDDVETGNNLTVTVNVSSSGSLSSVSIVSTAAGQSAVDGYTWAGRLSAYDPGWLRIELSDGTKVYYDVD